VCCICVGFADVLTLAPFQSSREIHSKFNAVFPVNFFNDLQMSLRDFFLMSQNILATFTSPVATISEIVRCWCHFLTPFNVFINVRLLCRAVSQRAAEVERN